MSEEIEINEEIKKLIIARIDAKMPPNLKISIGNGKSLTKEEMIEHVKREDSQGKHIVAMHINFIKAVANGKFTKAVSSV